MTPAEAQNWRDRIGKTVCIEWRDDPDGWQYFIVRGINSRRDIVQLTGVDRPDGLGRHAGDTFWADACQVRTVEVVE